MKQTKKLLKLNLIIFALFTILIIISIFIEPIKEFFNASKIFAFAILFTFITGWVRINMYYFKSNNRSNTNKDKNNKKNVKEII